MGIDLHVEDENGKTIESISDNRNILLQIITTSDTSSCTLLKYIDAYGDTVFNQNQLVDLVNDFSQIIKKTNESTIKEYLSEIHTVLEKNINKVHVYFKFYGD